MCWVLIRTGAPLQLAMSASPKSSNVAKPCTASDQDSWWSSHGQYPAAHVAIAATGLRRNARRPAKLSSQVMDLVRQWDPGVAQFATSCEYRSPTPCS